MTDHAGGISGRAPFWDDLAPGYSVETGEAVISAEALHAFAAEYDPQPQHLDATAAGRTILGQVVASGWQTLAMTMRLVVDARLLGDTPIIAAEFGRTRFHGPVRAGDRIKADAKILSIRPMTSRDDRGFLDIEVVTSTTAGTALITQLWTLVVPRRPKPNGPTKPLVSNQEGQSC
ncbi:MaoC like domain protein [Sphingopyxis sp. LC81]|uniref:MaoC/PaaZ C-terminal domain-containing protein n=1 Tax=Sphingopyxis sp. LC81 TaxID=1502850 RepID=UPI00050DE5DA|nr:MaoC/PaaZ C-terminal domain-containing protein [Sphingopyxis sp. LC81]KGB53064.1 MaoC like domain protein [Sphingopyxis sp. LC81]